MKAACEKNGKYLIGGTPGERESFFDKVLSAFPHCFWLEGCAAPTVKDYVIEFTAKPNAKPVARQPIPLSPYDEMRVEYHIFENLAQGKLRKLDTLKEGLPDFATPVFVVDQERFVGQNGVCLRTGQQGARGSDVSQRRPAASF